MPAPILLLATELAGEAAGKALRIELDADVEFASSARAGMQALRLRDFSLVILDETLAAADAVSTDRLYQASTAPLLELNLAITSAPRLVRQARAALVRRTRDLALAHTAASTLLQSELNETLAGILLESELALRQATPEQAPKLRQLVQLAGDLRDRLRVEPPSRSLPNESP
jgi:hypothetical protein